MEQTEESASEGESCKTDTSAFGIEHLAKHLDISECTANPAPLGFTGYGIAAFLLSLTFIGVYPVGSMIVSLAIFIGGIAEILAGLQAWRRGDVFAGTAFAAYGLFWPTFAFLVIFESTAMVAGPTPMAMVAFLGIFGIYTLGLFIATLGIGSRAIQFVIGTLFLLFITLAIGNAGVAMMTTIGGYIGAISGLAGIYTALAMILNEVYGRTIAPI
ncbi:GPR1/FUN34/yaaH family protein [Methanohalobium evestigatum Z-7303]|uniref:GPR1/FUN34/yaaH family protein n=1 Tax=Methanohalobium evestigatum (strain ATCC BAA-1072 / DSM 3721 / NBRC 107634 / OCM 161 / Z-7303) TaxID=644295 RepID=D7E788_METEZ|nr:GPR1/FUN34/YaaH family transporter [Methanohalobium evestigatum]ADI73837.1 GPR1/FUN34/yaaH family protein [Methanohalobium evestigatum Z-7303]